MKTDQLIRALAADARSEAPLERDVAFWLVPALLLSVLLMLATIGLRDDLAAVPGDPAAILKTVLAALLALIGGGMALRLVRPGAAAGRWPRYLLGLAAFAGLVAVLTLAGSPRETWMQLWTGQTMVFCLVAIPTLALVPLVAALLALRRGAPTRPARAGAAIGLATGAAATVIYSLHCFEDSPLFYLSWYGTAIAIVTALGALLGARLLRW